MECHRPVTRVLVEGGRAVGVVDAAGGLVRARRAVLADVPAPVLFCDLVGTEHLPARMVDDLARFQYDDAILKVDWALSSPIPWTAPEPREAGTVHLGGDVAGLVDFGADLAAGRMPREPFMLLGQMTLADPLRSPPGTESVWAYTHLPHRRCTRRRSSPSRSRAWTRCIERHAPGFGERVVARVVSRPGDLEARNPSLVGGALMAGTAQLHQMLVFRPTPGLGRPDTPVERLFLAGATAHPAGAVHGAPGANAARAALARDGRLGALYGAGIRAGQRLVYGADVVRSARARGQVVTDQLAVPPGAGLPALGAGREAVAEEPGAHLRPAARRGTGCGAAAAGSARSASSRRSSRAGEPACAACAATSAANHISQSSRRWYGANWRRPPAHVAGLAAELVLAPVASSRPGPASSVPSTHHLLRARGSTEPKAP